MSAFLDIPDPNKGLVKIMASCYKRPDVSWDYFIKYWRNTHVFKFTRNPKVEKLLVGYVQCHRDEESSAKMGAVPLLDWDGYAEFYVRRIEDWLEIANEPQHLAESMTDMDHFCDSPRMKLLITNYEPRFWNMPTPPPPPSKEGKEVQFHHADADFKADPKWTQVTA